MIPREGFWMTTKSGRRIYFDDPRPEDFEIEDIAHGLANVCRYSGQCVSFYSVAEHCFRGSLRAADVLKEDGGGSDPVRIATLAYAFLMHDSPEAYMGDMVHGLKQMSPSYAATEAKMLSAISAKFKFELSSMSDRIDRRMLVTEAPAMFTHGDKWWEAPGYPPPFENEWVKARHQPMLDDERGDGPIAKTVDNQFMPPRQAKALFLARFKYLREQLKIV